VRWAEQVRAGVAAHLGRHDSQRCPACHAETLEVNDKPVLLVLGGAAWPNPPHMGPLDKDTQVDFMVRVECSQCGYNLLFNSDRFHGSNSPAFVAQ